MNPEEEALYLVKINAHLTSSEWGGGVAVKEIVARAKRAVIGTAAAAQVREAADLLWRKGYYQ